jgi:hypothetical protein
MLWKRSYLEITERDKQIVLNYYKKLSKDHNRGNDYLKGLIVPVAIKREAFKKWQ